MICLTGEGCIYATTDGQRNAVREGNIWLLELDVSAAVCAGVRGLSEEQEEENAKYMFYYLLNKGWSKEAICGLSGNIDKECGMNPGAWQIMDDKKLGYGLVQWSPGKGFIDYVKEDVNDLARTNPKELMNKELEYLLNTYSERWYPDLAQTYLNRLPPTPDTPTKMTFEDY